MTEIPRINRDAPLIIRLLPIIIAGLDGVLDYQGKLYFRLLCRLVDKAANEYADVREYIRKEIETKDRFGYRFFIMDHLENCVNAISRATKALRSAVEGKSNLLDYISKETLEKIIDDGKIRKIRNRIEHIDEDIQEGKFQGGLFLDIDESYEKICINRRCISLQDLASIIEKYHWSVLEIIEKLPNRRYKDKYYWDKKPIGENNV